jgi:isopentenyl diphosphate isomerase/L-lactate dehydrogenase-like FMN-dependent dehydrogenase
VARAKKRSARSTAARSTARARETSPPPAGSRTLAACACIQDLEAIAKKRLSRAVYDYYAGGAEDEQTLDANREAFRKVFIRPRALVNVGVIDTAATALGIPITMPVMVAPTAYQRMAHRDGELATARAAGEAGTIMVASTIATYSLEKIAKAATGPLWFQLYVQPDRSISRDLAHRAEAAGYRALCLTVDTPQLGRRERDVRNQFALPHGVRMMNFEGNRSVMPRTAAHESAFAAYASSLLDPTLTWDAIAWLRSETKLPIVVKGIISGEDAALAVQAGAAAIVVSNHGGRQLDACEPTLAALPNVVESAAGRVEVYLDGGVRRGTDVIKALALGARAVLVGRPVLWGLAAGGQAGVRRALEMLRAELELAMTLAGCPSLRSIGPGSVVRT